MDWLVPSRVTVPPLGSKVPPDLTQLAERRVELGAVNVPPEIVVVALMSKLPVPAVRVPEVIVRPPVKVVVAVEPSSVPPETVVEPVMVSVEVLKFKVPEATVMEIAGPKVPAKVTVPALLFTVVESRSALAEPVNACAEPPVNSNVAEPLRAVAPRTTSPATEIVDPFKTILVAPVVVKVPAMFKVLERVSAMLDVKVTLLNVIPEASMVIVPKKFTVLVAASTVPVVCVQPAPLIVPPSVSVPPVLVMVRPRISALAVVATSDCVVVPLIKIVAVPLRAVAASEIFPPAAICPPLTIKLVIPEVVSVPPTVNVLETVRAKLLVSVRLLKVIPEALIVTPLLPVTLTVEVAISTVPVVYVQVPFGIKSTVLAPVPNVRVPPVLAILTLGISTLPVVAVTVWLVELAKEIVPPLKLVSVSTAFPRASTVPVIVPSALNVVVPLTIKVEETVKTALPPVTFMYTLLNTNEPGDMTPPFKIKEIVLVEKSTVPVV